MIPEFEYHSPETLAEACELLKKHKASVRMLAGGTDLIPKMVQGQLAPKHVVNVKRITELNKISFKKSTGLTLGSLVRFNDLIYSDIIKDNYPILVEVSKKVATHQVRNLATIGGNLCNAAPSADSAPILIALDSKVTIVGPGGKKRVMSLSDFFVGPGKTALEPGEILTQITIPPIKPNSGMAYYKHSIRNALEIAIVGVAVLVQIDSNSDQCIDARVVIAACSPTPLRVPTAEQKLIDEILSVGCKPFLAAADQAGKAVKPISDIRASEGYRREMVNVQCKRVLDEAFLRAQTSIKQEVNE